MSPSKGPNSNFSSFPTGPKASTRCLLGVEIHSEGHRTNTQQDFNKNYQLFYVKFSNVASPSYVSPSGQPF